MSGMMEGEAKKGRRRRSEEEAGHW